jgi:hypothetical protein
MGTPKGREAGVLYLREFVEEMKASGFVARGLEKSGQGDAAMEAPVTGSASSLSSMRLKRSSLSGLMGRLLQYKIYKAAIGRHKKGDKGSGADKGRSM